MKKNALLLAAALIAVCLASLSACGDNGAASAAADGPAAIIADVSADAVLDAAIAAYSADEIPPVKYYRSTAAEDSDEYLDPDYAGLLIYNEFGADTGVFTRLEGYAMCVPQGKNAFEIDVLKLADEADAAEALALLQERFNRKNNGEIETYVPEELPILDGVQYYAKGRYVIMICTSDNAKAVSAVEALING